MLAGAVHETVAWELPAVAVAAVGAPGSVYGVTAFDAEEAVPVPAALVAVTVKVYEVPGVRPVMLQVSAPDVVQVSAPGELVTV